MSDGMQPDMPRNKKTENQAATLPPVMLITDEVLSAMYEQHAIVTQAAKSVADASVMTVRDASEKLISELLLLTGAQCEIIHGLKAEIERLRKYGLGAE